jgi:hypothetical protein
MAPREGAQVRGAKRPFGVDLRAICYSILLVADEHSEKFHSIGIRSIAIELELRLS